MDILVYSFVSFKILQLYVDRADNKSRKQTFKERVEWTAVRPETRKRESCGWSESSRGVNVFLLQTCICRKLLLSVQSSSAKVQLLEIWHAHCVHECFCYIDKGRKKSSWKALFFHWEMKKNLFVFRTIVLSA